MGDFKRLGILGVGSMGGALLAGLTSDSDNKFEVTIYDQDRDLLDDRLDEYDVKAVESVGQLAETTDFLIVCVKPSDVQDALEELQGRTCHLITIAAGVKIETFRKIVSDDSMIIRVMPNTPAQVGEGMSFLAPDETVSEAFLDSARSIFESVGRTAVVEEKDLDAATALSGSGPAYVFYFLEALEEAGVYLGLENEESRVAALQTVLGAARLAATDDRDPSQLRQAVSSPGGTTVEALQVLDDHGVKGKIKDAVIAAFEKSKKLGESK